MTLHNSGSFHSEAPKRTDTSFDEFHLSPAIRRAVQAEGYTSPTPIQSQAIPLIMRGRDVVGIAQTGTGKTAAFALPILHLLSPGHKADRRAPRTLVLTPTRELAEQIVQAFRAYGRFTGLTSVAIYGGVGQGPQTRALDRGVDVVVATPGRLLDLMGQRRIDLRQIQVFVLDEADRMFDMGFIADVRSIAAQVPKVRQTLLFSATMPDGVRQLASSLLSDPMTAQAAPQSTRAERVEQTVYFVPKAEKPALLQKILEEEGVTRTLVFTRTRHGADRLARSLVRGGFRAEAIHGDKAQNARLRAIENFRSMATPVLVATDLASRGLDIDDVSHVVNFDLPNEPETYVHRIGRTARAGASGIALSFCDAEERGNLLAIEALMREQIPVMRNGVRRIEPQPPRTASAPVQLRPARSAGPEPWLPRRKRPIRRTQG